MAKLLGIDTDALKRAGITTGVLLGLANGEYNAGERRFVDGDNWWKAQAAGLTVDNAVDGLGAFSAIGHGIVDGVDWLRSLDSDENPQGMLVGTTLPEAATPVVIPIPDRAAVAVVSFTVEQ